MDEPLQIPPLNQPHTNVAPIVILVSLITALVIGSGVYFWQQSQINSLKKTLQSENSELKSQIDKLVTEQDDLKQQIQEIEQKACKGIWKNGVCIKSSCVDSDVNEKPSDIYIKGSVAFTDENSISSTVYDECTGSKQQVNEMWCYENLSGSGNYVQGKMVYDCPKGCLDGACIK